MCGPRSFYFQRNNIAKGILKAEENDIILISDLDEIPNPEVLEHASEWVSDDVHFTFQQSCYSYWFCIHF